MAGVNRMSMMEQVHLAGEDEDDIYEGFNDYSATLDTEVCGLNTEIDQLSGQSKSKILVINSQHNQKEKYSKHKIKSEKLVLCN